MIRVRVPATTANIGPGFDTLGLALNLYNEFIFTEIEEGLQIDGFEEGYRDRDNLVYKSMMETFGRIGYEPKGIKIEARINIPISRGLGSSASCILGGIMGANEMAGRPLDREEIFYLATKIEGHPDNISPALFGGFTISIMEGDRPIYNSLEIHKGISFVALVPDFSLTTREAREVLPSSLDYSDGVRNVGRVSLLLSSLVNGRFDLLKYAVRDRLHQPYRSKLIADFDNIVRHAESLDALGVFLSGAGPTIMCMIGEDKKEFILGMEEYLGRLKNKWKLYQLEIDTEGSRVL